MITKDEHIAELQRLAAEAEKIGNFDAAVEATYAIGKVLGFYRERVIIEGGVLDAKALALVLELLRRKAAEEWPGLSLVS